MPRSKRVEFAGAIYHVINRGNYRSGVFEALVLESCERFGWELHAYCIMSNHYHLAVGTPEANLSVGL